MPFETGKSGNEAGRPKGTQNKATKSLREMITAFVNDNWSLVEKDFQTLKPIERLQFFEKILKYALPTLQAVHHTDDLEKELENLSDEQLENLMDKILSHNNN